MAESVERRVSSILLSKRRRSRFIRAFILAAVFVSLSTAGFLMRNALTKGREMQVLNCTQQGNFAHVHGPECYDASGSLICPLEERELHTHDSSCFDADGKLICNKPEVTQTHVHGAACYKTVLTPEQKLQAVIQERDKEGKERNVLTLVADAPEGSLPENTTLRVERVGDDEYNSDQAKVVQEKVFNEAESVIKKRLGDDATIERVDSCEVAFFDSTKLETYPILATDMRLTSTPVRLADEKKLQLVYVDANTGKGKLLDGVKKVNADPTNTTKGSEDTLTFKLEKPGSLVVCTAVAPERENVLPVDPGLSVDTGTDANKNSSTTLPSQTLSAEDGGVRVLVDAPSGALPEGASVKLEALSTTEAEDILTSALNDDETTAHQVTSAAGARLRFLDANGAEVKPGLPVSVSMGADAVEDVTSAVIAHEGDVSTLAAGISGGDGQALTFTTTSPGAYALGDVETLTAATVTAEGETYHVSVSYGVDAHIPDGATLEVKEIAKGSNQFASYHSAAERALGVEEGDSIYARLFDISIMRDGHEVEPAEGSRVDVRIQLDDAQYDNLKVVHFEDDAVEGESLDATTEQLVAGAGKLAATEGHAVSFSTSSFSLYEFIAVNPFEEGGIGAIGNGSFVIVRNTQNNFGYALLSTLQNVANLKDNIVVTSYAQLGDAYFATGEEVSVWKFVPYNPTTQAELNADARMREEHNTDVGRGDWYDWFTVQCVQGQNQGKYLSFIWRNWYNDASMALSDDPFPLMVMRGAGDRANSVSICQVDPGNNRLKTLNFYNQNQGFGNWLDEGGADRTGGVNQWVKLYDISNLVFQQEFYSKKVSATQLTEGKKYLVYQEVYNPVTRAQEIYAIDGNGGLVRVYDKDDEIRGRTTVSPFWEFSVETYPSGLSNDYYDFKSVNDGLYFKDGTSTDTATGKYLFPQAGDKIVTDVVKPGVTLDGKRDGTIGSNIEAWDDSDDVKLWYEYKIVFDAEGNASLSTIPDDGTTYWHFAELKEKEQESATELHQVETVDSASKGITIRMFDYPNGNVINNLTQNGYATGNYYNNSGTASMTLQDGNGNFDVNGFPVITKKTGDATYAQNLFKAPFDPDGQYFISEANNLFIKAVYDSTGFYEYSAFKNFAHFNQAGDLAVAGWSNDGNLTPYYVGADQIGKFTVYQEIGAPGLDENNRNYFMQRGNYFPYMQLSPNVYQFNHNWYQGDGEVIDLIDPSLDGLIHYFEPLDDPPYAWSTNFYFGMSMEFDFTQPRNGLVNGTDAIFEFNGDDDTYVYIDGVKILDIGGNHDALPGSFNFRTGHITYAEHAYLEPGQYWGETEEVGGVVVDKYIPGPDNRAPKSALPTTIFEAFKMAGKFPDGTDWVDGMESNYFTDYDGDGTLDTFKDFSKHSFKMLYAESGAGASNLDMRFNLIVSEPGAFTVEKKLQDEMLDEYGAREFEYQAYVTNLYNTRNLVTSVNQEGIKSATHIDRNGVESDLEFGENGIFKLKANEQAKIVLESDQWKYDVREVNIHDDVMSVTANSDKTERGNYSEDPVVNKYVATPTAEKPGDRPNVSFLNEMEACDLVVAKEISEGVPVSGDTFQFRVWLERVQDGKVMPAPKAPYTVWQKVFSSDGSWDGSSWERVDERTHYTGIDGTLMLEADQKAVIHGLVKDTKYVAIEDGWDQADYDFLRIDGSNDVGNAVWTPFLANAADNYWTEFTNGQYNDANKHAVGTITYPATTVTGYNRNGANFTLLKADGEKASLADMVLNDVTDPSQGYQFNPDKFLSGAKFNLSVRIPQYDQGDGTWGDAPVNPGDPIVGYRYRLINETATPRDEVGERGKAYEDVEVAASGKALRLRAGIYQLTETVKPTGYARASADPIYFRVFKDGTIRLVDSTGVDLAYPSISVAKDADRKADEPRPTPDTFETIHTLQVYNIEGFTLLKGDFCLDEAEDIVPKDSADLTQGYQLNPDKFLDGAKFKVERVVAMYKWGDEDFRPTPKNTGDAVDHYDYVTVDAFGAALGYDDVAVNKSGEPGIMVDAGIYRISENLAPQGYIMNGPVFLRVNANNSINLVKDGSGVAPTAGQYDNIARVKTYDPETDPDKRLGNDKIYFLQFLNEPGTELPKAGGPGTKIFTIVGALVCTVAAAGYALNARRRFEQ